MKMTSNLTTFYGLKTQNFLIHYFYLPRTRANSIRNKL
uniref:Uncharacterized protein n=1 Tax=Romanomermis culicivorax TaxID=13658 RepID=A0A915JZF9_ROMCU